MAHLDADQIGTVTFDKTADGYDPEAVDTFLTEVSHLVNDLQGTSDLPVSVTREGRSPSVVARAMESLRAAARASAASLVEQAAADAEDIVAAAHARAAEIVDAGRVAAEELCADAVTEGERLGELRVAELEAVAVAELAEVTAAVDARRGAVRKLQDLAAQVAATLEQAATLAAATLADLDAPDAPAPDSGTELDAVADPSHAGSANPFPGLDEDVSDVDVSTPLTTFLKSVNRSES